MLRINVQFQIMYFCSNVFTLIAKISHSLMFFFQYVSSDYLDELQHTYTATRISNPLVLTLNVYLQIYCLVSNVIAQVTGISHSFMFRFNVSFRLCALVKTYSHWSQGHLTPSCLFSICFFRIPAVVAAYSHWWHGYLTPLCLDSMCNFRLCTPVATYSHWSQGYLTPSCLFLICSDNFG